MRDGPPLAIGPALADAVVLIVSGVDAPFVVRLEAVRSSFFSQVHNGLSNCLLRRRTVAQEGSRDGEQVPARQRTIVKGAAIGRDGDTVGRDPKRPRRLVCL